MKIIFFSTLLLFCLKLNVYANVAIKGYIIDVDSKQPIENVSVILYQTDSVISQNITKSDGSFTVYASSIGTYILKITHVSYNTSVMEITNIGETLNLGAIELSITEQTLDEVIISAKDYTKIDRQVVFPPQEYIKTSSSGLDVLAKVMLHGIKIDPVTNAITSINNRNVQLRINDVIVSVNELLAIQPQRILRIEHIDRPGAKYGDAGEVINFILKKQEKGSSTGGNARAGLKIPDMNDFIYFKYNNRQSEFGLTYNLHYSSLSDYRRAEQQTFQLADNNTQHITKISTKSPRETMTHHATLSYNWNNDKNSILNVFIRNYMAYPGNSTNMLVDDGFKNTKYNSSLKTKDRIYRPSVDLYFQHTIDDRQSFTANVVGTHISSIYKRNHQEFWEDNSFKSDFSYDTDGKKYSLISNIIYEIKLKENLTLSSAIKYSQAYIENLYLQRDKQTVNSMNTSDIYGYAQLQGSLFKIGYQLGIGFSQQYFNETAGQYTKYLFRPNLSLFYPIKENMTIRYGFEMRPTIPGLSSLSNFKQWQNEYELTVGNPHLKPYNTYVNDMSYNYRKGRTSVSVALYHQYNREPVMSSAVERQEENGQFYFLYSSANQKSYHHLQGRIYLTVHLIKNRLNLSIYGVLNRYINEGNTYTHCHTGYMGGMQLEGTYKNWSLSASFNPKSESLFSETLVSSPSRANLGIRYKYKSFQYGMDIVNPFIPDGGITKYKLLSNLVQKETTTSINDYGNFVRVYVAWNLEFGRKYKSVKRIINNSDNESGIVK